MFEFEPDVSRELADMENVVITPHIGTNILEARKAMAREALNGLAGLFQGKKTCKCSKQRTFLRKENPMETIKKIFSHLGVIPVVVINDPKDALPLAEALIEGGLPCAEVTLRTEAAEASIRLISQTYPDMLVGAGTVLTLDQVKRTAAAGAKFIVSPGFDPEIVDYCISEQIPVFSRLHDLIRDHPGRKERPYRREIFPGTACRRPCHAESPFCPLPRPFLSCLPEASTGRSGRLSFP